MRKEKTDTTLTFYDVELHATPAEYYECMHIEDPDITEDHWFPHGGLFQLPYQDSAVRWETGNGVFRMFGKILKPTHITFTLYKGEHTEDRHVFYECPDHRVTVLSDRSRQFSL